MGIPANEGQAMGGDGHSQHRSYANNVATTALA